MTASLPAPEGFDGITPYLCVDDAAGAIAFYVAAFGATEDFRVENRGQVGHAELTVFGAKIMLSDPAPERGALAPPALGGSPVVLHVYVEDVDAALARAVEAGATLAVAAEDRFYGDRSGVVVDPFGHRWSLATRIEALSAEELKRRAAELFGA